MQFEINIMSVLSGIGTWFSAYGTVRLIHRWVRKEKISEKVKILTSLLKDKRNWNICQNQNGEIQITMLPIVNCEKIPVCGKIKFTSKTPNFKIEIFKNGLLNGVSSKNSFGKESCWQINNREKELINEMIKNIFSEEIKRLDIYNEENHLNEIKEAASTKFYRDFNPGSDYNKTQHGFFSIKDADPKSFDVAKKMIKK
jgi:hypothetical protein